MFVLAPAAALPADEASHNNLQAAQRHGPAAGFALRIFSRGQDQPGLEALPCDGRLLGEQRRAGDGTQLLCDAIVPLFEPQQHWLGVYRCDTESHDRWICLDRFALSEASNDTCWFYPSHDGTFLSWERGLRLTLAAGTLASPPDALPEAAYDRQRNAVLWSLLGDDISLTCVGLTYGGHRIDWPLSSVQPERMATWSRFRVDSAADVTLMVEDCRTVFHETFSDRDPDG